MIVASIKSFILSFLCGFRDSFLGIILLITIDYGPVNGKVTSIHNQKSQQGQKEASSCNSKKSEDKTRKKDKVLPMLFQCCVLNGGVLLLSVLFFEKVMIPAVKNLLNLVTSIALSRKSTDSFLWQWVEPSMSFTFKYLWVIPLFWVCKILNCIWFVEIGDVAYRKKYGRPLSTLLSIIKNESIFKALSRTTADILFSIKVELFFMIQAQLVSLTPYAGSILSFGHMSLLYSLYAFEYTWMNFGWSVMKRLSYVERNWIYFIGFGTPLTVLTNICNSTVISACIFGIVFPLFILSGLEAKPEEEHNIFSLHLFSPVIWLTNKIFLTSRTVKTQANKHQNAR